MAEDDDDDDDDWEEGALGMEECLFCSHVSASLEKNIKHMSGSHSFFLPDTEYLSDLEGLISYLGKTNISISRKVYLQMAPGCVKSRLGVSGMCNDLDLYNSTLEQRPLYMKYH